MGLKMAELPVDPLMAKMLLMSDQFGVRTNQTNFGVSNDFYDLECAVRC